MVSFNHDVSSLTRKDPALKYNLGNRPSSRSAAPAGPAPRPHTPPWPGRKDSEQNPSGGPARAGRAPGSCQPWAPARGRAGSGRDGDRRATPDVTPRWHRWPPAAAHGRSVPSKATGTACPWPCHQHLALPPAPGPATSPWHCHQPLALPSLPHREAPARGGRTSLAAEVDAGGSG